MTEHSDGYSVMNGKTTGYKPQWRYPEQLEWSDVPLKTVASTNGVPGPLLDGGVLKMKGLCGKEQALAIAWIYSAQAAGVGDKIEVGLEEYEVEYQIESKKVEKTAIEELFEKRIEE